MCKSGITFLLHTGGAMRNKETLVVVAVCGVIAGGIVWFSAEPIIPTYKPQPLTAADTAGREPRLRYEAFGILSVPHILYLRNAGGDLVTTLKTTDGYTWDGESAELGGKCHLENVMEKSRLRVDGRDGVDYQSMTGDGETEPLAVYTVQGKHYSLFLVPD